MMNPNEILKEHFNPTVEMNAVIPNLLDTEYRAMPGFAPSDLKRSDSSTKGFKERGHPLKMVSDIDAAQRRALGLPLPPGYRDQKESTDAQVTGSLYHLLLMEPNLLEQRYAVVTKDVQDDILRIARDRKIAKNLPQAYNGNLTEAREFKRLNGGRKPSEEEQAQILAQAQKRKLAEVDDADFHTLLPEYKEWLKEQVASGKSIIFPNQLETCQAMVDAINDLEANRAVKEELAQYNLPQERCEVSLFATIQMGNSETTIQVKGRPDGVPDAPLFFDPKTAISCHFEDFALDIAKGGYDLSMGGYSLISQTLANALPTKEAKYWGFPKTQAAFLAQEKTPPFLAKIWHLPHSWLNYGAHRWLMLLRDVLRCHEENSWHQDNYEREFPDKTPGLPSYIEPPKRWLDYQNAIAAAESFKHIPEPQYF